MGISTICLIWKYVAQSFRRALWRNVQNQPLTKSIVSCFERNSCAVDPEVGKQWTKFRAMTILSFVLLLYVFYRKSWSRLCIDEMQISIFAIYSSCHKFLVMSTSSGLRQVSILLRFLLGVFDTDVFVLYIVSVFQ